MSSGVTVAGLADEYQTGAREILALCVLLGIPADSAASVVPPGEVARLRDVLEGRAPLPEPKARKTRSGPGSGKRVLAAISAVVVVVIVVTIAGALAGLANRDAAITVQPGQCFNEPSAFSVTLKAVVCSEPHDYKAFGAIDLDSVFDAWPGEAEIVAHAERRCQALAQETGQSAVEIYYFGPKNESTWTDEDTHRIVCAVPD